MSTHENNARLYMKNRISECKKYGFKKISIDYKNRKISYICNCGNYVTKGLFFKIGKGHCRKCVGTLFRHNDEKIIINANKLGMEFLCIDINDPNLEDETIKMANFLMDDDNLIKVKKYISGIAQDLKIAGEDFVKELRKKYDEFKNPLTSSEKGGADL